MYLLLFPTCFVDSVKEVIEMNNEQNVQEELVEEFDLLKDAREYS